VRDATINSADDQISSLSSGFSVGILSIGLPHYTSLKASV
tara:strand:+ start:22106 stop:22225 length:120 start_codon:yes stop_codon:yes gene_type:complete